MLMPVELLVLVFAKFATAAPIDNSTAGIGQVATGAHFSFNIQSAGYKPDGWSELYKSQRKYGANVSDALKRKVEESRRARVATENSVELLGGFSGSATAESQNGDEIYISPVMIQGRSFNLQFDTGSSDLWVLDKSLHGPYEPNINNKVIGASFEIQYADNGFAVGDVFKDTVSLGGLVVRTTVESAHYVSSDFLMGSAIDGVLGLGFGSINQVRPIPQKTWFEDIMDNLAMPVFAADLKHNAPGSYDFGKIQEKYANDIKYVKIDPSNGWYEFDCFGGFKIGNQHFPDEDCPGAVADTGTALLRVSTEMADRYYALSPSGTVVRGENNGIYIVQCNAGERLPSLSVRVGDFLVEIPGSAMVVPNDDGTCLGGLQGGAETLGLPKYIYGDIFLKQIYAVFDYRYRRFGFVEKNRGGNEQPNADDNANPFPDFPNPNGAMGIPDGPPGIKKRGNAD